MSPEPSRPPTHNVRELAREQGYTRGELAELLGISEDMLDLLDKPDWYDHFRVGRLRRLARVLRLPWPEWMGGPAPRTQTDAARRPRTDAIKVHVVLTTLFDVPVPIVDLAAVLGWPTSRVSQALDAIADAVDLSSGFVLIQTPDHVRLAASPRLLDAATRKRLAEAAHARKGTDPVLCHLIAEVLIGRQDHARLLARLAPRTFNDAVSHGYLAMIAPTEQDVRDGHRPGEPIVIMTPELAYNLGFDLDRDNDNGQDH
ncbi:hypothetical protein MCAG_00106 [Micromonospora sp. ATCC 39149]|nr:hypothetical protein MCAG_00106 [Micromonospora sp. ATCC 39149]